MSESSTFAPLRGAPISAAQIAEHEGLVRWLVCRQWLGGLPFEDALHEGRIGLWAALRRYDPERGTAFSTYAVPAITHAVWHAVSLYHQQPLLALPAPSLAPDPLELVHRSQVEAALHDLVEQLPPRWRQIVVDHYGLGDALPQSLAAIARRSGVSRQRIHYLHRRAILWLAHPAHSLPLRRLLERHRRTDYQQSMARQRQFARLRHRPRQAHPPKQQAAPPKSARRAP